MPDHTLLADEIESEAVENGLLVPFDHNRLKGASYDLAAGRTIVIVEPETEGITPIDLEVKHSREIPPGRAAILYSLEKVRMPVGMKGRLSMKSSVATKLLLFAGGPIDPGYKGHLFLPLANLSDVPIRITYGEAIVTAEFVRLGQDAQPYSDEEFDSIPNERLPVPPRQPVFDPTELTGAVKKLQLEIQTLRAAVQPLETNINATSRIVDAVVLGALAGIGAGIAGGGIIALFTQVPDPWNIVTGVFATLTGLGAAMLWAFRRRSAAHES